jgi:hypothetical protein
LEVAEREEVACVPAEEDPWEEGRCSEKGEPGGENPFEVGPEAEEGSAASGKEKVNTGASLPLSFSRSRSLSLSPSLSKTPPLDTETSACECRAGGELPSWNVFSISNDGEEERRGWTEGEAGHESTLVGGDVVPFPLTLTLVLTPLMCRQRGECTPLASVGVEGEGEDAEVEENLGVFIDVEVEVVEVVEGCG